MRESVRPKTKLYERCAMLCYVMLCYVMLGYYVLGY